MSDCCSTSCESGTPPGKKTCPANGKECSKVSVATILHHIKQPWRWNSKEQGYYFCDDPECDVIYFGQDNSVIRKDQLRTIVGVKDVSDDSLICYCFGVSRRDAISSPEIKQFVAEKTKQKLCACESRNPSGKCCLKDFPKVE